MDFDPEERFLKTPDLFSTESRIIAVETRDVRGSMVLNDLEDVVRAVHIYGEGNIPESDAPNHELRQEIASVFGKAIPSISRRMRGESDKSSLSSEIAADIISHLQGGDYFDSSWEFEAMGTAFFRAWIHCEPIGDKYVFNIGKANTSQQTERLAQYMERPMALDEAIVQMQIGIVDDYWVNVNVEEAMKHLPFTRTQIGASIRNSLAHGFGEEPRAHFKHGGKPYALRLHAAISGTRPMINGKYVKGPDMAYAKLRGSNLVGPAWKDMYRKENRFVIEHPYFVLGITLPAKCSKERPAVTLEEINGLMAAREYISGLIQAA